MRLKKGLVAANTEHVICKGGIVTHIHRTQGKTGSLGEN